MIDTSVQAMEARMRRCFLMAVLVGGDGSTLDELHREVQALSFDAMAEAVREWGPVIDALGSGEV